MIITQKLVKYSIKESTFVNILPKWKVDKVTAALTRLIPNIRGLISNREGSWTYRALHSFVCGLNMERSRVDVNKMKYCWHKP